jgi:hypothetical protein
VNRLRAAIDVIEVLLRAIDAVGARNTAVAEWSEQSFEIVVRM